MATAKPGVDGTAVTNFDVRSIKVFWGLFIMHDVILIAMQIYRPKLQQTCTHY